MAQQTATRYAVLTGVKSLEDVENQLATGTSALYDDGNKQCIVTKDICGNVKTSAFEACEEGAEVCTDDAVHALLTHLHSHPRMTDECTVQLMNWGDKATVNDLEQATVFAMSSQVNSYFDTLVGNCEGVVDYQNKRASVLCHSGDNHIGPNMLCHAVHTSGHTELPMYIAFTAYSSSYLHQFGVAVMCLLDAEEDILYAWPLYNRKEEVGATTTTQHGFSIVWDGAQHVCVAHSPRVGETTVVGARAPLLRLESPDHARMVKECEKAADEVQLERATLASLCDISYHNIAPTVPLCSQPSPVAYEKVVSVRHVVDAAVWNDWREWMRSKGCAIGQDASSQWLCAHSRLTETPTQSTPTLHTGALLLGVEGLSVTGGFPWLRSAASTSLDIRPSGRLVVVCAEASVSDTFRNRLVEYGKRATNTLLVVRPTDETVQDTQKLCDTTRVNIAPLIGRGTELVLWVGDRFIHVLGTSLGDKEATTEDASPPCRGDDVTDSVYSYIRAIEGHNNTARASHLVDNQVRMFVDGAEQDVLRVVRDLSPHDLPTSAWAHRLASCVELLDPCSRKEAKRIVLQRTTQHACEAEKRSRELLRGALAECADDVKRFPTHPTTVTALAERRARRAEAKQRRKWWNTHFWQRLCEGASEGRSRRAMAVAAATEAKNATLRSWDEFVAFWEMDAHWLQLPVDNDKWHVWQVAGRAGRWEDVVKLSGLVPDPQTNRAYELLDGVTGACLLELAGPRPSALGANAVPNQPARCALGVPTHNGSDSLLLPLTEALECDGSIWGTYNTKPTLDFSAAAIAESNTRCAVERQMLRQVLFSGTRLAHQNNRLPCEVPPQTREAARLLVDLYLTIGETLPATEGQVDPADPLPTVLRRLVVATSLVLGAGQKQLSGVADFLSSRRPKVFPMVGYEWSTLLRLARLSLCTGWDRHDVARRLAGFIVRYLNARVVQPVVNGLRSNEAQCEIEHHEALRAEAKRRTSPAYKGAMVHALWLRWRGETVPQSLVDTIRRDTKGVERMFTTERSRRRLLWRLLTNATWDDLVQQRCLSGMPTHSSRRVASAVEWHLVGRLRREIRDAYCRCAPSVRSSIWNDTRTGPVLRSALGERTCNRFVPDVIPSLDTNALAESRTGFDVDMAHSSAGRMLVETLRKEGFECTSWTGDWTMNAPPHTTQKSDCDASGALVATVANANSSRTMKELFAIARVGGCPKAVLSQFGTDEGVAECLGMCEEQWVTLRSIMGWTEARVVEALEAGVRASDDVAMEDVITTELGCECTGHAVCDRLMRRPSK